MISKGKLNEFVIKLFFFFLILSVSSNAKSSAGRIRDEVEHKQILFNGYLFIVQKLLSLLFVKVIKGSNLLHKYIPGPLLIIFFLFGTDAFCYHKKYLCNVEFDNVYITNYFKKIDSKRRRQGHHTLLPPKNVISSLRDEYMLKF